MPRKDHVIIAGAGFAGLACARELGRRNVRATIIDRQNYHLFVPLLYQVATGSQMRSGTIERGRRRQPDHKTVQDHRKSKRSGDPRGSQRRGAGSTTGTGMTEPAERRATRSALVRPALENIPGGG